MRWDKVFLYGNYFGAIFNAGLVGLDAVMGHLGFMAINVASAAVCVAGAVLLKKRMDNTMDLATFISNIKAIQDPNVPPPDPAVPLTLGWRYWTWDADANVLRSPQQGTPWPTPELRTPDWDTSDVVRGVAGIHARLVPVGWERLTPPDEGNGGASTVGVFPPSVCTQQQSALGQQQYAQNALGNYGSGGGGAGGAGSYTNLLMQSGCPCPQCVHMRSSSSSSWPFQGGQSYANYAQQYTSNTQQAPAYNINTQLSPDLPTISGIVERFGRYVLGTEGWRAEWVIIRKLLAPNTEIGLALERAYPDVEVIYAQPADAPSTYVYEGP